MAVINERIHDFFDKGKIKEAILGKNNYFIPDITYREQHDRLLIFRQLCLWMRINNKFREASIAVQELIEELYVVGTLHDLLDVIFCFLLVKIDDQCDIIFDMNELQIKISEVVKKNCKKLSADDELREMVISLSKKLPNLKLELNL